MDTNFQDLSQATQIEIQNRQQVDALAEMMRQKLRTMPQQQIFREVVEQVAPTFSMRAFMAEAR